MPKLPPKTDATINGLAGLDKLLEHRSRLGACVLLSHAEAISFSSLRELLGETDGNLGVHLRKLEDASYVAVSKKFEDRKPVTWYILAAKGQHALKAHLEGAIRSIPRELGDCQAIPRCEMSVLPELALVSYPEPGPELGSRFG